jgi:hypothetical protein
MYNTATQSEHLLNSQYVCMLTCEHTGLALSQAELRLQVLGKEYYKSWHNDELHAGTKACNHVHRVAHKPPHW